MAETSIEWTKRDGTKGVTWNPTTGCDKVSPGCGLPRFEGDLTGGCYAMAMAKRLKAMGSAKYQNDGDPRTSGRGFGVTVHPDTLGEPLKWKTPRTVFVNSMSDLGHARVPTYFLAHVWAVMAATPQHTYQILSKRPERMARILSRTADADILRESFEDEVVRLQIGRVIFDERMSDPDFARRTANRHAAGTDPYDRRPLPPFPLANVWLGTSIEMDEYTRRADDLRATPAAVRFISAEPLLGPLPSLDLTGIDWLIIGGESGPGARAMELDWVYHLVKMARATNTAIFVKQLGSVLAGGGKGGNWDRWPADLRIRTYPTATQAVA